MDFTADALCCSRRFRTLSFLDEGVCEGQTVEIDTSLWPERVVRVLEQLKECRGLPQAIRCDNGPEYTAQPVVDWCQAHGVELHYIQPGKPTQNAYIERFNRTYRTEVFERASVRGPGPGTRDQRRVAATLQRGTPARVTREPATERLSRILRAGKFSFCTGHLTGKATAGRNPRSPALLSSSSFTTWSRATALVGNS